MHANAIAPKYKNLFICLSKALFTLSIKSIISYEYSEVLPISPIRSDDIYAIIGKERPDPTEPNIASIIKTTSSLSDRCPYILKILTSFSPNIKFFFNSLVAFLVSLISSASLRNSSKS